MSRKAMVLALCLAVVFAPGTGRAEDFTLGDAWTDTKLYFTAPLRWDAADWLYFGGALAAVGAAHEFDGNVRRHFADPTAPLDGKDPHSMRDALPAAAAALGTWAFATVTNDDAGRVEAYSMAEAGALATATSYVFKTAAGRLRPNETTRVDEWRSGGSSFPSLHASAAFAIGTVLAESGGDDYRWLRRLLGYGIAGGTVYVRLHGNQHWLSDTVSGAVLGAATAHFVLTRREERAHKWDLSVMPAAGGGLMLSFNVTPD